MTPQQPYEAPTRVYSPEPIIVGPNQSLVPAQGFQSPVIVVQQAAPQQSWIKAHSGELIAAFGAGGIVVAVLLAAAIVAVAVGVGAISCAIGFWVIKGLIGPDSKK